MGSEMCIRDRIWPELGIQLVELLQVNSPQLEGPDAGRVGDVGVCLLYTSDAADERSSVDLGGRRIIKKKKRVQSGGG